jgi:predicted metal-dependent hydrolase
MNPVDFQGLRLLRKKGRKRLTVFVLADNVIEVRAPLRTSDRVVREFLLQAAPWIRQKLQANQERPSAARLRYVHGEKIPWQGKEILLHVLPGIRQSRLTDESLTVHARNALIAKKKVAAVYSKHGEKIFQETVSRFAPIVGKHPARISVRGMKSRWGSCSHTGSLSLNWKILAAPQYVIDYLIVHELCHLIHANHSSRFWAEVERVLPEYKEGRKFLKDHGSSILIRFD